MIFKQQRPLAGGADPVLAYDQRREFSILIPMTDGLRRQFGAKYKIFVEADVVDGKCVVGKTVADRGW